MDFPQCQTAVTWLLVTPIPRVFDPSKRLQDLKDGLNPESSFYYFYTGQHPNIRAVIKAYEDGKMPLGSTTYFKNGNIVSKAEAAVPDTFVWEEHVGYRHSQRVHKQAYTAFPGTPDSHMLRMEVRLRPIFGGDGTRLGIFVLNDTGSSTLTILETDLGHLGNIDNYYGWCYDVYVTVGNGTFERLHSLWVEVRFVVSETVVPWGPWIVEQAVVRQVVPGIERLSGAGMRQLFFPAPPPVIPMLQLVPASME